MHIQLSDHFDYQRLLRFTLPSIIMMIFTSIYGVVDGFFVSNFVGKTAFSAVNFIFPVLMIPGKADSNLLPEMKRQSLRWFHPAEGFCVWIAKDTRHIF